MVCPFAEIGMDVDKPHQLEMMRADLSIAEDRQLNFSEFLALDEQLSNKLRIIETDHALKPLAVIFAHSGDSWLWLAVLTTYCLFR